MSFKEWRKYKLADLVESDRGISYGIVQPGEFQKDKGVPILKVNNLTEGKYEYDDVFKVDEEVESKYKRTKLKGNEILISLVGSLGHIFKVTEKQIGWNVVRAIGVLPIHSSVNRDWVYWYLKTKETQEAFQNFATHTVQATLNLKELKEIEIKIPEDIATQKRIINILSSLDDKIELNRQTNQTLENIAQTLFKEWFINYNYPNATGEMQDSELGQIPKGWKVGKLGEIIRFIKGKKPKDISEIFIDGYVPQILIETLDMGKFSYANPERMTLSEEGDILMVMDGASSGRVEFSISGVVGSTLAIVKPVETLFIYYVYMYLKINESDIKENTTGSSIPHADKQRINNYDIIYSEKIIKLFNDTCEPIYQKISIIQQQIQTLIQLRDTLLPKLMRGEIEV
jgi:type I restriction enzyme S subunit